MNSKNERICRLCLKVARNKFQELNEIVKQILCVLLLKLDLDVTKDPIPIICENCMEVAKKCLHFKSTCIGTEEIVVLFSIDRVKTRYNIRDIYEEREHAIDVVDEHLHICRFCLTRLEKNNFVSLDSWMSKTIVDILLAYMPEVDLNIIKNPVICTICRENLHSYFMFVTNCLDTEGKIMAYCIEEETDSTGGVILGNVLHFLFEYILQDPEKSYRTNKIKEEPGTCEDTDLVHQKPHSELMKLEEELDIKEEEISLKESLSDMLDKYGDMFASSQHDKETKPDISCLETERHCHLKQAQIKVEDISNWDAFKVNTCESNDTRIDKHILCTDERTNKMRGKQKESDLITNSGASEESLCKNPLDSSKQQHVLSTPGRMCGDYKKQKISHQQQDNASKRRKKHMSVQIDPSEIEMHKCSSCDFESKYKNSLKSHMLLHKDVSEIKMYKCSLCTYESKENGNLKRHMLVHKDVSEVKIFKCTLCSFATKHKRSLKKHMFMHGNYSEIRIYKCSFCSFETKYKLSLKMHMVMHGDYSEIRIYKCSFCSFETTRKLSLKRHKLLHSNISEIEMYKCASCAYKSNTKSDLIKHMLIHKDITETQMYICSLCAHKFKRKTHPQEHMTIHKDISEIEMHRCLLCSFETKHKTSLRRHMLSVHKDTFQKNKCTSVHCAL